MADVYTPISSNAGRESVAVLTEFKKVSVPVAAKPRPSDRDMMYAWSMGVANRDRERNEPQRDAEVCPPEVYIG